MGKHSARRETEKKSKGSAKILVLVIGICILVGVVGYVIDRQNRPKNVVNEAFTELKAGNKEIVNNYLNYEELIYSLDEMLLTKENEQISNIEKNLFNTMDWSIENTEIDDEKATVVVEVTNKDFVKVITSWMKQVINEKSKGTQVDENMSLQKLQDTLTTIQERKTVIKKITLSKEEGNWKINVDENLRDLVYPGIDSVITVLNQNNK